MAKKHLIFYLGDDEAYFKTLQREFKTITKMDAEFKHFFEAEESKIQSLFVKVSKLLPDLVFIDYSKETQDYLHLTRLISRTPLEKKIITVGLMDILTPHEVLAESISAGVSLAHIKGSDAFDAVYDSAKILSPEDKLQHGFATAKFKEDILAGAPAKVGYIEQDGIHIETDFPVSKGDRIRLKTHWTESKIFPSQEVFVKNSSTKNLFYQFKQNADADFVFVDEFVPPEGMEAGEIRDKIEERKESIKHYRGELHRWIDDNLSRSLEKKAKVLVIDEEFTFYQDQKRTDKHPYTIRCIPFLKSPQEELSRLGPQVIAVALDPEEVKGKNNEAMLINLAGVIKTQFADLHPFLVIFNTKLSSKEYQCILDYGHVMTTQATFSVEVLVRMAEIFENKMKNAKVIGVKESEKVFIKKTNAASNSEIMVSINLTKLSETDMFFETDAPLKEGMNLHITQPVEMYVHVVPVKGQGKVPEFYGMIHAIGEKEKKELRRFINSVFFRDHDAKVTEDTEAFKSLNEAKLKEKLEAQKKAEEEAQKAAESGEVGEKKGA